MKTNYHTHNALCTHARGNVDDYCKFALEHGFTDLGISDHGPLLNPPFKRMTIFQFFQDYLKQIEEAKKKYAGKLNVYASLEMEYLSKDKKFLESLRGHVDYLVLGPHYYSKERPYYGNSAFHVQDEDTMRQYTELIEEALDTGLFKILAHPDLFMTDYKNGYDELCEKYFRRIIEAAIRNNVLIEVNANGFRREDGKRGYPCREFFALVKEYDAPVIISSDAHDPENLVGPHMDKAEELVKELGLKLVEKIEF